MKIIRESERDCVYLFSSEALSAELVKITTKGEPVEPVKSLAHLLKSVHTEVLGLNVLRY